MNIRSVEFAGAVSGVGGSIPGGLPAVAFTGRSNVGKSSLINRLLGRTRTPIARVSRTPGRTQQVNFYRVRATGRRGKIEFFLVDLPGYGYARAPASVRARWEALVEWYLSTGALSGVVQLVDSRHGPTKDDLANMERLAQAGVPVIVALTKVDKLRSTERDRRVSEWTAKLGVDEDQVIPVSAHTGEGRDDLLDSVEALICETDEGS